MSNHHMHPTIAMRLKWVESLLAQGYSLSEAIEIAWNAKWDQWKGWHSGQ